MSPEEKDPLDVDAALDGLAKALALQLRSALSYTLAAGSVVGFEYQGLSTMLWTFAASELEDARRLTEKMVTLGGEPQPDVAPFAVAQHPGRAIEALIDQEDEAIEALQDIIPSTGHTGDSEALEHRLEHMIMRKQEQVDTLRRASRQP